MYTCHNYKTKKELIEDFKAGKPILCYQPGPFECDDIHGTYVIEGPHFPKPHRFYLRVRIVDSIITEILK